MPATISREQEYTLLNKLCHSKHAELIAVYGRRRVGKTFLIRNLLNEFEISLEATGMKNGTLKQQLTHFTSALSKTFFNNLPIQTLNSWEDAFALLSEKVNELPKNKKIVIFLDELPWLATKRSKLLEYLDYYWNTQWSKNNNFKLICCGSAASWMLNNLINAKGGLYNRVTRSLLLEPFTLTQTKEFLNSRHLKLKNKEVLDCYMVAGGVPFYLEQFQKGLSVTQNIEKMCFQKDGLLFDEFPRIFKALFDQADVNFNIVKAASAQQYGISREDLLRKIKMKSGGTFNKRIEELIASGFIAKFIPYGMKKKSMYYRVVDEYTLFYLRWIEPAKQQTYIIKNYWTQRVDKPEWRSWSGYAFESICYKHIDQIGKKLGLRNIPYFAGNWRRQASNPKEEGAQIDLLFDRDDGVITLCEIKYSKNDFTLDKATALNLTKKIRVFEKHTKTKKHIQLALVTTHKLKHNIWSEELIDNVVTLDDII